MKLSDRLTSNKIVSISMSLKQFLILAFLELLVSIQGDLLNIEVGIKPCVAPRGTRVP